jgi:NhaP-type Na+/H+ or K+/H+ antiporter
MIVMNLIVGIGFGLLTPWLERKLREWSERLYMDELPVRDHEFDVLAVLAVVALAAIACAVLGVDSSAFLLAVGIGLGVFGKRIWNRIKLDASEDRGGDAA